VTNNSNSLDNVVALVCAQLLTENASVIFQTFETLSLYCWAFLNDASFLTEKG